MDFGSILLLLALVVIVAGYLYKPFREGGPTVWEEDLQLSELLSERDRVLDALVELEFDNELGKVPEEIYGLHREALLREGAEYLKALEELYPEQADADEIEAQVAARRAQVQQLGDDDDPLEALINQRRAGAKAQQPLGQPAGKAKFCPECGQTVQTGDRFCTACGTKL